MAIKENKEILKSELISGILAKNEINTEKEENLSYEEEYVCTHEFDNLYNELKNMDYNSVQEKYLETWKLKEDRYEKLIIQIISDEIESLDEDTKDIIKGYSLEEQMIYFGAIPELTKRLIHDLAVIRPGRNPNYNNIISRM